MKNNLPIKEDNSFLGKIKKFFRKLFYKNAVESNINNKIVEEFQIKKHEEESFQESIKVESQNDYINEIKKEEFLDNLEKNPELFYELSIEKLEKLEEYYNESIKKQEEKLAKIKKAS